jgi:hypothetical protein
VLIEDRLQTEVQSAPLAQKLIELRFTQNAAKPGLGQLRSCVEELGDLEHGQARIDHAEKITAFTFTVTLPRVTTSWAGTSSAYDARSFGLHRVRIPCDSLHKVR